MKTKFYLSIVICCVFIQVSFAFDDDKKQKPFGFAVHNAEVQVTPHADYMFFVKGKDAAAPNEPYENRYPFIGFNFGAQYLFRPIQLLAISTGLNLHMQGGYWRVKGYIPKDYVAVRQNYHVAALMIPLYLHLYKRMLNSTFEFAAGPDFYIPLFYRSRTVNYGFNGDKIDSENEMETFNSNYRRENAVFGLSIFLGAQLYLCSTTNLFIGPQIAFMNLAYFDKDSHSPRIKYGGFYDVYLGLKLGFRFHCKKDEEAHR